MLHGDFLMGHAKAHADSLDWVLFFISLSFIVFMVNQIWVRGPTTCDFKPCSCYLNLQCSGMFMNSRYLGTPGWLLIG